MFCYFRDDPLLIWNKICPNLDITFIYTTTILECKEKVDITKPMGDNKYSKKLKIIGSALFYPIFSCYKYINWKKFKKNTRNVIRQIFNLSRKTIDSNPHIQFLSVYVIVRHNIHICQFISYWYIIKYFITLPWLVYRQYSIELCTILFIFSYITSLSK